MMDAKRLLSRRAVTLGSHPAAWGAALAQRMWGLQPPCPPARAVPQIAGALATIYWPSEYQHFNAAPFVRPLREGLGRLTTVETRMIPQPYKGIVMFDVRYQAETFSVAVDYYDYAFINQECLGQVALYFKMQHLPSGYADPRILPGGYIAGRRSLYDHYCRLRELRRRPYKFEVYGRFSTRFSAAIRCHATAILQGDSRFEFAGGTSLALYMQSLREAARARVCIDMPGNGPFCFRLVEYLAIGCCIIAPRHAAIMHADLRDREQIVYCRDDLADLADLCAHYVENDQAREAVAANAASFFDEHLHPVQLASYYLRMFSERLYPRSYGSRHPN
jgi:Glycosyl transferases group 1